MLIAFNQVALMFESSALDVVAAMFNDVEHLPCFAHSLLLVVLNGLSNLTAVRTMLEKCSKLASLLHHSASLRGAFESNESQ